jgi:uncharacterized protein YcfJ
MEKVDPKWLGISLVGAILCGIIGHEFGIEILMDIARVLGIVGLGAIVLVALSAGK